MDNKKTLMFFGGPAAKNDPNQPSPNTKPEAAHGHPRPVAPAPSRAPEAIASQSSRLPQPAPNFEPGRVGGQSSQPAQGHFQPGRVSQQPQRPPNQNIGGAPNYNPGHAGQPGQPGQSGGQPWGGNQGGHGPQGSGGHNFMGGGNPLGNMTKGKIIGTVVAAIAVAIIGVVGMTLKNKIGGAKAGKHTISYNRLGLDKNKANVDDVIDSLGGYAAKWKKDASWLAVNFHHVRPDGTVDLTKGSAVVKFVSPSRVRSKAKSVRKDSIKEYSFGAAGARSNKIIGARKPWEDFEAFSLPGCKVSNVVATMNERGFDSGTVRITFSPSSNVGWNWKVFSKNKELDGYYAMSDCSYSKTPR